MAEAVQLDYSHWLDQDLRTPLFVPSLKWYVVLYEVLKVGQTSVNLREALQQARDFAKDLEGVVEGVNVKDAETMTLAQYVQLVRELRVAPYPSLRYNLYELLGSRLVLLDTHLKLRPENEGEVMVDIYERGIFKKSQTLIQDSGFVVEHEPETYVPLRTMKSDAGEFWFYLEDLDKSERGKDRAIMWMRLDGRNYIHAGYPLDAKVTIGSSPDKYIEKVVIPIILYRKNRRVRKNLLQELKEAAERITTREQRHFQEMLLSNGLVDG